MNSQNNYPIISASQGTIGLGYIWTIPLRNRKEPIRIHLRNGSTGFLLCHLILWWYEAFEAPVIPGLWGWFVRDIIGSSTPSNHGSGTAADINAPLHPLGKRTMGVVKRTRLAMRLRLYKGCIRSGAFYLHRLDEMHAEINMPLKDCEVMARRLMNSPRGKRILAANPTQKAVILS